MATALTTPSKHNDPDQEILTLLKQQATYEQGFRLLVQCYQERLYWHIRSMVKLHEDTDEVLQNTFIKVYKAIDRFEGNSKLYTWLYRIATNESLSFLKKRNKRRTADLDNEDMGLANQLRAEKSVDGELAARLLREALETLPQKQRMVFVRRYYDEMTYKEISAELDTSVGALKASYHHAAKKIEAYIKNQL